MFVFSVCSEIQTVQNYHLKMWFFSCIYIKFLEFRPECHIVAVFVSVDYKQHYMHVGMFDASI